MTLKKHRSRWTLNEYRYVEKHYGILPTVEIAKKLERTPVAIRLTARALGCSKAAADFWTEEEEKVIRTYYAEGVGITYVRYLLPGRSRKTIFVKARNMGVGSARNWSQQECEILKEFYPKLGVQVSEKLPGRTKDAVKLKACSLGVKYGEKK